MIILNKVDAEEPQTQLGHGPPPYTPSSVGSPSPDGFQPQYPSQSYNPHSRSPSSYSSNNPYPPQPYPSPNAPPLGGPLGGSLGGPLGGPLASPPMGTPAMPMNPAQRDIQLGQEYQQRLLAQCARGMHDSKTDYGIGGIIAAIVCFPIGLICLCVDRETKCTRCGVRLD
ncbi:hypothetical protein JAAARDRAFT_191111 [Jaapia argillacea MUCL 33604]|uniref:Membrane protein BRI3 n=1 Tax=Jaapia argillacea MUCL 33604 TaxID=933084 RepID=A0A067Q1Q7_9AGAM|nr:hypothetical protein JAAARDRAFT_191111 [Jaapia argillacea MUCL 33604]